MITRFRWRMFVAQKTVLQSKKESTVSSNSNDGLCVTGTRVSGSGKREITAPNIKQDKSDIEADDSASNVEHVQTEETIDFSEWSDEEIKKTLSTSLKMGGACLSERHLQNLPDNFGLCLQAVVVLYNMNLLSRIRDVAFPQSMDEGIKSAIIVWVISKINK